MPNVIEGFLNAKGKKFGVVVSRFNELVSKQLLQGTLDCLKRHECDEMDIDIVWVPGSFEIPAAAQQLTVSKKYNAVICLGAVIRGATPHYQHIAAEVTKGIAQVGLNSGVPTIYGVITPDTLEQAFERAGTKGGNKGWDAALSAIEMADLFAKLNRKKHS